MARVPEKILKEYNRLKGEYPFYVSLKRINGKYYLYKQLSRMDKETGKPKVTSTYLGRIADDGAFMKKFASEADLVENAKSIIIANGGRVIMPDKLQEDIGAPAGVPAPDAINKKILTILSMNARSSMAFIGSMVGLKPSAVYSRVKQLEKDYKIKYTVELDLDKLGYHKSIVFVKFLDKTKKPTVDEIRNATAGVPNVQLAVLLNGQYDLMIYLLAKRNDDLSTMVNLVRDSKHLSGYEMEWHISYFYGHYNFVPLRGEFIDMIKGELKEREYYLLKEFNANSSMGFTEVDKKYGLEKGRTDYAYYGLKRSGVLIRPTISMQNNGVSYIGLVCITITKADKFVKNRKLMLSDMIGEGDGLLNRYLLSGDIGISKGVALFVPVYGGGDLERVKERLESLDLGATLETYIITNIALGSFCFRRFDNAYAIQHKVLVRDYRMPEAALTPYDEAGRHKNPKIITDIRGAIINTGAENDDES
jgi:DNA-binding Lrp family transcriptional regulator